MKPELIEEKIRKGEEKIERESLSIVEEKSLQRQITQWKVGCIGNGLWIEGLATSFDHQWYVRET